MKIDDVAQFPILSYLSINNLYGTMSAVTRGAGSYYFDPKQTLNSEGDYNVFSKH